MAVVAGSIGITSLSALPSAWEMEINVTGGGNPSSLSDNYLLEKYSCLFLKTVPCLFIWLSSALDAAPLPFNPVHNTVEAEKAKMEPNYQPF